MEILCELLASYLEHMVVTDLERVQCVTRRLRKLAKQSTMWMPVYEQIVAGVQSAVRKEYAQGRLFI
jgi:hypothetical protein